jgi:hypothetical protein
MGHLPRESGGWRQSLSDAPAGADWGIAAPATANLKYKELTA